MISKKHLEEVQTYFENTLKNHGQTARGVDWNSDEARAIRFDQLAKIIDPTTPFSLLDYGSGYGALAQYLLSRQYPLSQYVGYDIVDSMVQEGQRTYPDRQRFFFTTRLEEIPVCDYATACGVFNMKLEASYEEWTPFVLDCLQVMFEHSRNGFSVNFLTKYSDQDRMRPDLYYADPCFLFDYCKTHFSRNVALLHDYTVYDFTLLIRKIKID
jgi:hypothetical protein